MASLVGVKNSKKIKINNLEVITVFSFFICLFFFFFFLHFSLHLYLFPNI